jgi:hypothetical protein
MDPLQLRPLWVLHAMLACTVLAPAPTLKESTVIGSGFDSRLYYRGFKASWRAIKTGTQVSRTSLLATLPSNMRFIAP